MPQRGTQQGLKNFEAKSHRLEPLAMVNAKSFWQQKIGQANTRDIPGSADGAVGMSVPPPSASASLCSEPKTIASKKAIRRSQRCGTSGLAVNPVGKRSARERVLRSAAAKLPH
jgi:hypothetical protein